MTDSNSEVNYQKSVHNWVLYVDNLQRLPLKLLKITVNLPRSILEFQLGFLLS
jgi:hypothetical protein